MRKKILNGSNKDKVCLEYSELNEAEYEIYKKVFIDIDFIIKMTGSENLQLLATSLRENPNILNKLPQIVNSLKGMGLA